MDQVVKPVVSLGLLGTNLDAGVSEDRWSRWRPTVALCGHDDLVVHRLELLYDRRHTKLATRVQEDIATLSPETEVRLHQIAMPAPWDFETVFDELLKFAESYPFDPEAEDYLIHITTGSHVAKICLFLLTESRQFPARLIQTAPPKRGRHDQGEFQIIDLDLARYDRIATRFDAQRQEALTFLKSGIATRNDAFNRLMERIERVAIASPAPILLTGPTGAGKSRLARRIFELKTSRRIVDGPMIEVNCATLRGDSAMSALFGHRKGAFTGAAADRPGLLRSADGGVLFLDEIGELGLDEQAMLLRAIETRRFLPVGADREVESDFQLIAGTNRDLRAQVREGAFREDLLARLDLWTFELPGLADRPEDVEPNIDYELERFSRESRRKVRFNREARERFLTFATSAEATWLANFRDLNGALTRMATLAPTGRITRAEVDEEIERLRRGWHEEQPVATDSLLGDVLGDRAHDLDRFDRVQLEEVLQVCRAQPTLSAAGRVLFSESLKRRRSRNDADRLRKYLGRFDLTWDDVAG